MLFSIMHSKIVANNPSVANSNEARAGGVCFCPISCRVYAIPAEKTPQYRIGIIVFEISSKLIFPKIKPRVRQIALATKNCMQESRITNVLFVTLSYKIM